MKKKEIAETVAKLKTEGLTQPGVNLVAAVFAGAFAAKSTEFDKPAFMLACGAESSQ